MCIGHVCIMIACVSVVAFIFVNVCACMVVVLRLYVYWPCLYDDCVRMYDYMYFCECVIVCWLCCVCMCLWPCRYGDCGCLLGVRRFVNVCVCILCVLCLYVSLAMFEW